MVAFLHNTNSFRCLTKVFNVDLICFLLIEPAAIGLRQRLQTQMDGFMLMIFQQTILRASWLWHS